MRSVLGRGALALLIAAVAPQTAGPAVAASALEKGQVVIDGRVNIAVEVARGPQAQAKGLAGRRSLKHGTGMIFPYDVPGNRAFWMRGMLIPLDILWIRAGKIVAIETNLPPPSPKTEPVIYSHSADLVLEVSAGYAQEMEIQVGQSVKVNYKK